MIDKDISLNIVVADDDYNDHYFIKKGLEDYPNIEIISLFDGEKVIRYLNKTDEFEDNDDPFPHIILLDINMPKLSGFDAYEILKNDPKFKNIHLVVLSNTVLEDFGLCATISCYQKPMVYEKYKEVLEKIIEEWLKKNPHPAER